MPPAVLSSSGYTILNEWDRIAGEQPLARHPVLSVRRQSPFAEQVILQFLDNSTMWRDS
jgi:hypothetical protein